MILFINPRATRPKNRRFPLSLMAVAAGLPDDVTWEIIDGNRPSVDVLATVSDLCHARADTSDPVELIAMTVMPGPQLVSAVPLARELKRRHPQIPIVWGGYFPSLYPTPVLNAPYIDYAIRGQGEFTFLELLRVLRGELSPRGVAGLAFRDGAEQVINGERPWVGPDHLPAPRFDRIPIRDYLHPTFLGSRSGVYQASIGCPYGCKFCGVISVFGSREKLQTPERTARDLTHLATHHGMNAVHFYDNNFFVREDHALELCERIAPLNLSWWCEARIDALLRFSDETWRTLRRAGLKMVFLGAESGSDEVLRRMGKKLTTAQTLEIAARTREHGIVPEFSFVLGDPDEPERELMNTLAFIRQLKQVNPAMELITYYYTPTPQRRGTYGNVDAVAGTPATLEEWTEPQWVDWMTHENPQVPWLTPDMRARVDNFSLVLGSRYPSVHDYRTSAWGKVVGRMLAARRWQQGNFDNPALLRAVRRLARGQPDRQAYGHLRPAP
jgi:anaerobic magnesium-protoporphyrin IX monomethyl ester cyclase